MQTFLPYSDFRDSVACLDYKRLGKQRVEAMQTYNQITKGKGGYPYHPVNKMWQDYPNEYNCTLVSVYENGPMTLREVAEREHLSFARIKQIESKALKKLKSLNLIGCFRF